MNAEQQRQTANQEKMKKEMEEVMTTTKFPVAMIHRNFGTALLQALNSECAATLGCNWPMFRSLLTDKPNKFNMAQMGYALNAIESKTPIQMQGTGLDYVAVMDMQEAMAARWNEVMAPLNEAIMKKYQNLPALFIPHGKKIKR